MRDPDQRLFDSFMRVLGILICVAVGQVAQADPEELADTPAALVVRLGSRLVPGFCRTRRRKGFGLPAP